MDNVDTWRTSEILPNTKITQHTSTQTEQDLHVISTYHSTHISWIQICVFVIFTMVTIATGVLIVCLTASKHTNQTCQFNFKRGPKQVSDHASHPCHLEMGDFNEDGHLDIVVANFGIDNIGIFLNQHNGTFAPQTTYSTGIGSQPYSVAVADFNNDTHLDIAVAYFGINSIGVFLGDGNGYFGNSMETSLGSSRPRSLSVGDMNNDNILDIVVANYGTSTIAILIGGNNGSFRINTVWEMGYDSIPYFVTVADLNEDHRLDVIAVNYGTSELTILLNDINQSFTLQKYLTGNGSHPSSVTTGYFDYDKTLDIAVAYSGTGSIGIFFGVGNGRFTSQTIYSMRIGTHPAFIAIGDFNNDIHMDIVVADSEHDRIIIFQGDTNGLFSIKTIHSTGYNSDPCAMVVGDFDNDHKQDLAVINNGTNNLLLLTSYRIYPIIYNSEYVVLNDNNIFRFDIADFNGDNYLDIVVCNGNTNDVAVFINFGDGTFESEKTYYFDNSSRVRLVVAADVNNDGHPDIVASLNNVNQVNVLLGDADGTLTKTNTNLVVYDSIISRMTLGDFNNDDNLDIIATDFVHKHLLLYFGFGDGTFTNQTTLFKEFNIKPSFIQVSDVNNDSFLDIVIANSDSKLGIFIFLGDGNGSFDIPLFISTDNRAPNNFVIGDLNDDQRLDIVFTITMPPYVGILLGRGDGTFENVTKYFSVRGSRPWGISLGFYNSDAFIDIAVGIQYDYSINVYLGIGNGSFQAPTRISIGDNCRPTTVRFADFDNDDRQDIAVACNEDDTIRIFYFEDDADFTSETSYTTGSNSHPLSIDAGDFDHDGHSDIVVANSGTNQLEVLFHYNDHVFINQTSLSTGYGSHPKSVTVADFNRDHFLDIAVVNTWHSSLNVFLGLGSGSFATQNVYSIGIKSAPTSIMSGDLNKDGRMDLIVANKNTNNLAVFLAFDYVSFTIHTIDVPGVLPVPVFICTGDFNNDHLLDIAIVNIGDDSLGIYLGHGNGTFSDQLTYSTGQFSSPFSLAAGDFNNDSCLDLVIINLESSTVGVLLGYGNGSFQSLISYSTGNSTEPLSVAIGDFNQDGNLDIVVSVSGAVDFHNIWLFLGFGNGSFTGMIVYSMSNKSHPIWIAVDDLNNDTILDIVVANQFVNSIYILYGYGNGSFGQILALSTGDDSGPISVALADLNRDDNIDIIVANQYSNAVLLFYGHGNGSFFSPKIYPVDFNSNLQAVVISDINNDAILDIFVCDYNTMDSSIAIFYGFGDGNFTLPKIYPTGLNSRPYMIAVDDFNNDGRMDLAINYYNQDRIGVFIQVNSEPFGSSSFLFTSNQSHPESVALGDFNNDDRLDIAVTNSGNDNIGIFLGYGNGEFSDQMSYSTGENSFPISISVAYFNDDDYLDIAVLNRLTDDVVIFMGYGNGSFTKMITYSTGVRSMPAVIIARDLNQDKRSDLVVANQGSNEVLIFLGIGNGLFEEARRYTIGYDSRPQSLAITNINEDGMLDIAVASYGTGQVEILLQTC